MVFVIDLKLIIILDPQVVLNELARRQGLSGLLEKANRSH